MMLGLRIVMEGCVGCNGEVRAGNFVIIGKTNIWTVCHQCCGKQSLGVADSNHGSR